MIRDSYYEIIAFFSLCTTSQIEIGIEFMWQLKNWNLPTFNPLLSNVSRIILMSIVMQSGVLVIWTYARTQHAKSQFSSGAEAAQASGAIESLMPGRSLQRAIAAGNQHLYQITLSTDQYLQIVIDAQNVNLEITLWTSNRRRLRALRSRKLEPTPLSWISSAPGSYTLEIRCIDGAKEDGSYQLKAELRGKVAKDRNLLAVEQAFAQADRLREEWKAQSFLQAINKYKKASEHLAGLNAHGEEAYALKNIGDIYAILGENRKALVAYNQRLQLSKKIGDRRLEADACNDVAGINIDLGDNQAILECAKRAQTLSKDMGYIRGEVQALNNIGGCYAYVLGDQERGLDYFTQAMNLCQPTSERRGYAQSLSNIGHAHMGLGDTRKALGYFNQALTFWQALKDHRQEALVLTAIGLAHSSLGNMQGALDNHNQAMQLLKNMGDHIGEAVALNGMAYVYDTLGERRQALGLYSQALLLYRAAARRAGEAVTLGLIGEIYGSLGDKKKALDCHYQKLEISRALQNRRAEAYTLKDIGVVFDSLGDKNKALDYYNQALLLSQSLRDPRGEAYALNSIGYVYDRLGQKQKALELYNQALRLLHKVEDRAGEMLTLHNLTRVSLDSGDLTEAYKNGIKLLNITESLRTNVASHELRATYFASAQQHYELYIDVLIHMHKEDPAAGFDAAALEVSERARGRNLLDLLNEAGADIRQGVEPVLLQRERELQRLLNSRAERQIHLLSGSPTQEEIATAKKELDDLTAQFEEILTKIRLNSPQYAALTQPQTLNLSVIQKQILDENTVLLEYSLGYERSYLWVVTPKTISTFQLPSRAQIEKAATRLYEALAFFSQTANRNSPKSARDLEEEAKSQFLESAAQLSHMLLEPVASQLQGKRLLIVPDGSLQYVPFAALPDPSGPRLGARGSEPLVVGHEIVSLPSVSVLAALRKEVKDRSPAPKTIALLADPVFEIDDPRVHPKGAVGNGRSNAADALSAKRQITRSIGIEENGRERFRFQRLPFAWWEATAITKLLPGPEYKLSLGFDTSVTTATSAELRDYRIIHFATHALIHGVHPQLYGLVLSLVDKHGRWQDGFLRLNKIYNLKLSADLIVLSACQTALGKEISGEGLVGLTRGFMYAGAPRVIASLWKVDDRASAELMKYFYEALLGPQRLRPAAALQAAQIAMWKQARWEFPYYWAAFLLQGDWR